MNILEMPKNPIAIRREDLSKKGERRVAVTPDFAAEMTANGHRLLVQPKDHPETGTEKRAFADQEYVAAGAEVSEDLSPARVIFGLKEIAPEYILPNRTYLCFSHTHKGQSKNRGMLKEFHDRKTTLIDYELVTDERGIRTVTAFTYFAGYAGMIESFWALGERLRLQGHAHPLSRIPQTIALQDLSAFKELVREAGREIAEKGTPAGLPPFITVFLGSGKTSTGAQEIFDILPLERIQPGQIAETYRSGDRHKAYKCVMSIPDMFRLKPEAQASHPEAAAWSRDDFEAMYFQKPELFESNLDTILPYTTLLMNCVLWSSKFPRLVTRATMGRIYKENPTLKVIGDISCDPEGAVEFSRDTWVDAPVYVWHPDHGDRGNGIEAEGIVVMAVTNLPCAFSADASKQFARDLSHLLPAISEADYDAPIEQSGLPDEVRKAVILWKGEFTQPYAYMREFLPS